VTFPEFDENDSPNQKNNNFVSGSSSYVSINSLSNLTNINNPPTLFSPVLSHHGLEQHLYPANVFPPLLSLSSSLSNSPKVDSTYSDTDFKDLILHFTYGSHSPSSPPSPNNITDSPTSQEEFKVFVELSLHVFSFFSSHYYSMH
jgi:hypothetical protein